MLDAYLKTLQSRKNPETRMRFKPDLVKRLYRKGYSREEVIRLFAFMDWIMHLPEEFSKQVTTQTTKEPNIFNCFIK